MTSQLLVDVGTSHTVAVLRRDGQAPRPVLFDGSPLLPSGVYLDDGGALVVGRDALRLSVHHPNRFEPYPKRRVDDGAVLLGDTPVPVAELLAAPLRRALAEAGPASVALTCPADWGAPRRDVLRAAARLAGLADVPLIDEPIAAATYCAEVLGQPLPPAAHLLVFDFGGGTLDIAVVRNDGSGRLRVVAVGGLDDLGGIDVDAALAGHLGALVAVRDPAAWHRLDAARTPAELRDRLAFWTEVRVAKEMLSRTSAAPVQVPGQDEALHLTRAELDRIAGPLVDRAVDEARRVLSRAAVRPAGHPGGLAGVLLVGGSSRTPLVATRLHARLGVPPTVPEQPELPVAYGGLLLLTGMGRPGPGQSGVGRSEVASATSGVPFPTSPGVSYSPSPVSAVPVSATPAGGIPVPGPPSGPPVPRASPPFGPGVAGPSPGPAGGVAGPVPPVRQRRWGRRFVAGAVVSVLAVVGGIVGIGGVLVPAIGRAFSSGAGTLGSGLTGGTLRPVSGYPVTLGAAGQVAVAGGTGAFYAGLGGAATTTVRAVDASTGKQRWQVTVPVAPAELALRSVADLVVVDAGRSATNGGKDMRVVLAAADGHQLWSADWSDNTDVAYLGTDALVDIQQGEPFRTARVDLRTGRQRWSHTSSDDEIIANRRVGPLLGWPTAAAPAGTAVPVGPFQEPFTVDAGRVVELDGENGRGYLLDAATGHVTAGGALPLDDKVWTVFDGLVIGALSDDASPGQPAVGAFRVGDLARVWTYKLNPGDDVKLIHPCAQHLVCVSADGSDDNTMMAVRTTTGAAAWSKPVSADSSFDPGGYVVDNQFLYGDATFDSMLGGPQDHNLVLDTATGARRRDLGTAYLMAAAGRYALQVDAVGETWQVRLLAPTTGKTSGWLSTTTHDLPTGLALSDHSFAVVTKDRKLYVATAPSLS